MTLPTDRYEDEAWHRAALAGEKPPVHDGDPEVGWYKYRKFKGGPWIAVVVWRSGPVDEETGDLVGDEQIYAVADGKPVDPRDKWTWFCQYPITPKEYQALTDGPEIVEPKGDTRPEIQPKSLADADPVF